MTDLTCKQAGAMGGRATLAAHGRAFFAAIAAAQPRDRAEQRRRARKGAATTKDRYGTAFYEAIGKTGGDAVLARYGIDFYRELGRRSQAARRARRGT